MKLEQVSVHVWAVKPWFPVRVWLVTGDDGLTLVDAGLPFMASGILKASERLGAGPVRRILLTHGHPDHIGGVKRILSGRQIPVYAHSVEIPYLEGALPYPRRDKAQSSELKGLVQPLPTAADGTLEAIAGLKPYHTPGHSPGHVIYCHQQDRIVIAGDAFMSKAGKLLPPSARFTADMATAMQSGLVLNDIKPDRLEVTHGGPVLKPTFHE